MLFFLLTLGVTAQTSDKNNHVFNATTLECMANRNYKFCTPNQDKSLDLTKPVGYCCNMNSEDPNCVEPCS